MIWQDIAQSKICTSGKISTIKPLRNYIMIQSSNLLMSEQNWVGGIYIKDEGGYEIILKSLEHYKKRLRNIAKSPEIKDSGAMFGSILEQEAMKTFPKVQKTIAKLQDCLSGKNPIDSLQEDLSFLDKALTCYESDIKKAQDTGHEYYLKLVGNLAIVKDDLPIIKRAKLKIKEFD